MQAPQPTVGPQALFDLTTLTAPTTVDFYALPYPNDLRLDSDGTPALAGYHRSQDLVGTFVDTIDGHARGFGNTQAVYFRFDAALDPSTLPDPMASLQPSASVFLVDITPGSSHRGERIPVRSQFNAKHLDFIGDDWLAVQPIPGVPPRSKSTYAAIVTDGVKGTSGLACRIAEPLARVLANTPTGEVETRAATAYAPLRTWLAEHAELTSHVTHASVYTTSDVTQLMDELRTAVYATPAPALAGLQRTGNVAAYDLYTGTYDAPNFQEGEPPYLTSGGSIHLGSDGKPVFDHTESMRVAMSIPKASMPASGWPVVIYAHGTGGTYLSFVQDGTADRLSLVADEAGTAMARFAVISIDQVLHGPRAPADTDPNLAFFNFNNLLAAHDNPKQGALDDFQLLRLLKAIDVKANAVASSDFHFDATRIYFFGHSQGSLTGSQYVAAEPEIKAAVFSGVGAGLVLALLGKTKPIDIATLVQSFFGMAVDEFHPALNLLQGYFDDSDPGNYARRYFVEPPAGMSAKSVFVSQGLRDRYVPVATIQAFALAAGVKPVQPQLDPIPYLSVAGLAFVDAPQAANVAGGATGVLCQYDPGPKNDGHFVVFDVPAAAAQSTRFLASHAQTGMATLSVP